MTSSSSVQLDAAFPFSTQAQRIRSSFGVIGLVAVDAAHRRSVQFRPAEFTYAGDFCSQMGIPGLVLRDEEGSPWEPSDLWRLTGQLKLTRRRLNGGITTVTFAGYERRFVRRQRRAIPKSVRELVLERDEYRCVFCSSTEDLQIDHVMPWSLGGGDTEDNLQTLCRSCNIAKSNGIGNPATTSLVVI